MHPSFASAHGATTLWRRMSAYDRLRFKENKKLLPVRVPKPQWLFTRSIFQECKRELGLVASAVACRKLASSKWDKLTPEERAKWVTDAQSRDELARAEVEHSLPSSLIAPYKQFLQDPNSAQDTRVNGEVARVVPSSWTREREPEDVPSPVVIDLDAEDVPSPVVIEPDVGPKPEAVPSPVVIEPDVGPKPEDVPAAIVMRPAVEPPSFVRACASARSVRRKTDPDAELVEVASPVVVHPVAPTHRRVLVPVRHHVDADEDDGAFIIESAPTSAELQIEAPLDPLTARALKLFKKSQMYGLMDTRPFSHAHSAFAESILP